MQLTLQGTTLTVTREAGDRKLYKESDFWHALKKHLNATYHQDCIKKLMYKDGHLVDDMQYYLRQRKWNYAIMDNYYAIRKVTEPYNEGEVTLAFVNWEPDNNGMFINSIKESAA